MVTSPRLRRWALSRMALGLAAIVTLLVLATPGGLGTAAGISAGPVRPTGQSSNPCLSASSVASTAPCGVAAAPQPSGTATTTAGWVDVTGSAGTPPSPRSYTRSFAYDPVDGYLVTFGGYQGSYANDTWVYNGSWHQLHPHVTPLGRDHSTLIWDPVDGYVLMFGGSGSGGAYSDTWSFLGGVWTKLTPAHHPSARWSSDVVWDATDGYALLFGGCANGEVNDTWTFLGGNWTQLAPLVAPGPRGNVAMAFDGTMGKVILFGGDDWYGNTWSDTWTYSGGNWTNLSLTHAPSARSQASFAYDPAVHADVLFGGGGAGGTDGDTWWFSNGTWVQQHPSSEPDARYFGIMTEYPPADSLILWGGVGTAEFTDTWSYYSVNLTVSAAKDIGPAPFNVTLTATPSGGFAPFAVAWTFGDGGTGSGSPTNHTYPNPGAYQAVATVTDANGAVAVAGTWVQALVPLAASGVVAPLAGTAPLTIYASANWSGGIAPVSSRWDFGGVGSASTPSSSFTFSSPGSYSVVLSVTDALGELRQEGFSVVVSPQPHPSMSALLSATPLIGLAPLSVDFTTLVSGGAAPFSYAWTLGDGNTSTQSAFTHTYVSVGIFPVSVTITDSFGTTVTPSLTVEVDPTLTATAGALPDNGTVPLAVSFGGTATGGTPGYTYVWTFGDGNAAEGQSVDHTYAAPGTYTATLQVWDAAGATATDALTIVVSAPVVHTHPPPASTNSTATTGASLSLPVALGVSVIVGVAAAVATAVVMRRRR